MSARMFLARVEPFFTFTARLPPRELRLLTPRQIGAHLTWWANQQGHNQP